jgi:surfactin synthase thioesterase subunit
MQRSEWFADRPARAGTVLAPARIVCFAHAGGNPRAFRSWQPQLSEDAELLAVTPPHPAAGRIALADYIAGAAQAISEQAAQDARPIYLFGHSLGGLVAFEVCRRLREQVPLAHLVVSALAAPSLLPSERVLALAAEEGPAFLQALVFFGGMPPQLLAEPELLEVLLPGVKADFQLAAEYRYQAATPLDLPATVVTGQADPHVGVQQVEPWRREFSEPPDFRWVPGGHFYFDSDPTLITDLLRDLVRSDQHVELI